MKERIQDLLNNFMIGENSLVRKYLKEDRIYNEFSLQHELGIYLRQELNKDGKNYRIDFERNVKNIYNEKNKYSNHLDKELLKEKWVKKEIDIIIYDIEEDNIAAIELKFPRNGETPNQLYQFVKDIKFMEQLKRTGFNCTFCLTIVNSNAFYDNKNNKISENNPHTKTLYEYFRKPNDETKINTINKCTIYFPTGKNKGKNPLTLDNEYNFVWNTCGYDIENKECKYYTIEIK